VTEVVPITVPKRECKCPECGRPELRRIGKGKPSTHYEYVQPYFRRRVYLRETLSYHCGHAITARAPDRVDDKTRQARQSDRLPRRGARARAQAVFRGPSEQVASGAAADRRL